MANRPEPEFKIDEDLARHLLQTQAPQLAELELAPLSRGWDNTSFRLGDELVVRLPHRSVAAELLRNEQRWLPQLVDALTLPIPSPVFAGSEDTTTGYQWPWSVVPWFDGSEAAGATLANPAASARLLGEFFMSLHQRGPDDPPTNPYRGKPLEDLRPAVAERLERLANADTRWDYGLFASVFEHAAAVTPTQESVWLHGDLHLRNVVVNAGEIAAVIDWGDICTGDRATDLAAAYMLVPDHIDVVREHAGADDAAWARARGWALHFGLMYTQMSDDEPIQRSIGENLLGVIQDTVS